MFAWYRRLSHPVRSLGFGTIIVAVVVALNARDPYHHIPMWMLFGLAAAVGAGWIYLAVTTARKKNAED